MPEEINKDPQAETAEAQPAVEPQVTETPIPQEEPFDKERAMATINKLRDIETQAKKDKKELERLQAEEKKRADAQMSETERLQKERDAMAAENAKIKSDLLRREVIEEAGLPATFASRLQGATRDELLADAKELAKTLPQLKVPPKIPPTNPGPSQPIDNVQKTRAWLNGASGNPFDPNTVKEQGGGVFGG